MVLLFFMIDNPPNKHCANFHLYYCAKLFLSELINVFSAILSKQELPGEQNGLTVCKTSWNKKFLLFCPESITISVVIYTQTVQGSIPHDNAVPAFAVQQREVYNGSALQEKPSILFYFPDR